MNPLDRLLLLDTARAASPPEVLPALLFAFVFGLGVALLHRWSSRPRIVPQPLSAALVMLPIVGALVLVVIGDSLARAFSLVGALAIVRFRTLLRSPWDIAFVFLSLATGIACGVGRPDAAGWGLLVSGGATLLLGALPGTRPADATVALRVYVAAWVTGEAALAPILDRHTRERSLTSARSLRFGESLALTWRVGLRGGVTAEGLVRELSAVEGVERVILLSGDDAEADDD